MASPHLGRLTVLLTILLLTMAPAVHLIGAEDVVEDLADVKLSEAPNAQTWD